MPIGARKPTRALFALLLLVPLAGYPNELDDQRHAHFRVQEVDPTPEVRGLRNDHYPASNEMRIDLFRPYVENLGGAYMGVGTDQNLTFIAWARSDYAWLIDFDPVAVYVNRIHLFFISVSPTYQDFRALWDRGNRTRSWQLLEATFGASEDFNRYREAWQVAHRGSSDVPERLNDLDRMARNFGLRTFSNDPADYEYLRWMILNDRIQAIPGDLKGQTSILNISRAARAMFLPIRLVYFSNAEEYMRYPDALKQNIRLLPVDERSLAIRTCSVGARGFLGFPEGEKFPSDPLHYNLQPLAALQEWMRVPGPFQVVEMLVGHRRLQPGLSIQENLPPVELPPLEIVGGRSHLRTN
ncbi:MAG: hypothetical protein H7A21_08170 [Spirochaetales bacterium]|nr:hypothetical protein [Leptospiraceae bacterium]MCP5481390.1 hypothetical protein [Spirochaetales bacterium]MCP5486064.1 hypothetical protein [Spirochaetales bacterium]